ncbi:MAG: type II secretion system F family protein [Gaiellaceae bacterium]
MRRVAALAALASLALPSGAIASLDIRSVDSSGYPTLRATLVSDHAVATPPAVSENGTPAVGLRADNLGKAKAVVLALDRSQSMRGVALADALSAAKLFTARSGRNDQLSLLAFGSSAIALTPFATEGSVGEALRTVVVDSQKGTALYDAVVLAAHSIAQQPLQGRVIILLTDGRDYGSQRSLEDAVFAARVAHAPVYAVGIEGPQFDSAPLVELSSQTGGRFIATGSTAGLKQIYAGIARELARTWQVSFVAAARPGERVELQAALSGAGSATRKFEIPARLGAGAVDRGWLLPEGAFSLMGAAVVGLLVAIFAIAILLLLSSVREESWIRARLAPHLGERKQARPVGARERLQAAEMLFRLTESALGRLDVWRHLTRMLRRADVPLRTVEFVWVIVGSCVGAGMLVSLTGAASPAMLSAMLIGGLVPYLVVRLRMRRRLARFDRQLADLLVTIAASLKAGHSFKQGLQAVVDEGQEPASNEFRRVLTETALGRSMDEALQDMSERLASDDFDFVITAVTVQRQVGGSLADLFDMVADTVRQRQQFRRKVQSLTAMGRMSAYVLVALPFFLAVVLTLLNPTYMSPLFTSVAGRMMIAVGLVGVGVGALMLKRIIAFKG